MPYTIPLLRSGLLAALGVACLAAGGARADAVPASQRPVGEVTMSVGPVIRTPANGLPEAVRRGTPILPGDRLDTANGGHLHIRFIDGALVSIRPGSRMWVEDYRYDPRQVAMSLVRFKLEYGVARAISGAAAEGAKDRFRLNTPLVAIGVRGTDFVVRTGDLSTRAAVNQGAIVMAPLGGDCQAQALGPCGTPAARLLSADMGQVQVEFRPQLAQPEIKPLQTALVAANTSDLLPRAAPPVAPGPAIDRPDSGRLATTALAEGAVNAVITTHASAPVAPPPVVPPPVAPPPVAPPPPVTPPPEPPPVVVVPEPPPPVVVTPPEPTIPPPPPTLQWGRWAAVAAGDEALALPRAEAAAGRSVTVGNSQYTLYRNNYGLTQLAPGLGSYQFSLDKSFAQYASSGQIAPATVEQGRLTLDFSNARFSTELRVASEPTGQVGIAGAGSIRSDGIFFDRTIPGQAIAGSAALDGKSAGYFFEKAVGAGTLSGITLWSRP